ncbi:MAG: hypothetical protein ABI878_10515 [Acidobacteriota bacterium]
MIDFREISTPFAKGIRVERTWKAIGPSLISPDNGTWDFQALWNLDHTAVQAILKFEGEWISGMIFNPHRWQDIRSPHIPWFSLADEIYGTIFFNKSENTEIYFKGIPFFL